MVANPRVANPRVPTPTINFRSFDAADLAELGSSDIRPLYDAVI